MITLRINGKIDINQFWPKGSSDADTVKLIVEDKSFAIKKSSQKSFSLTKIFKGALTKGQGGLKDVIHTGKRNAIQTITIRLQGVDAPELHYKSAPLKNSKNISKEIREKYNSINKERRQSFGESATLALADYLKKFADKNGLITASFITNVNKYPSEVIDTYGRFVGNVLINGKHDINIWLVENGWGFPAFYSSMDDDEIKTFLNALKKGNKTTNTPIKSITNNINLFNFNLLYQKQPVYIPSIGKDKGKLIMPKLFRRQTSWMVSIAAGIIANNTSFDTFLKKSPDEFFMLDEFLSQGVDASKTFYLHDFVNSKIIKKPEKFVFKEKFSILINKNGKEITKW